MAAFPFRTTASIAGASWACATVAIVLCGCFDPHLVDGGFRCEKNGRCPSGFACVLEAGRRVCRAAGASAAPALGAEAGAPADGGGAPSETDAGGAVAGDGASGAPLVISIPEPLKAAVCAEQRVLASQIATGPASFGMAVDRAGRPHVAYLAGDSGSEVRHGEASAEGQWSFESIVDFGGTVALTAAIAGDNRMLIAFAGSSGAFRMTADLDEPDGLPHSWALGQWTTDSLEEIDAAASGARLWIAAADGDRALSFDLVGEGAGESYRSYCVQQGGSAGRRRVRAALGPHHALVSYRTSSGWTVHSYRPGEADCTGEARFAASAPDETPPLPVAVDADDTGHLAYVHAGQLLYRRVTPLNQLHEAAVLVEDVGLDARAVDVAVDDTGRVVIAYQRGDHLQWLTQGPEGWRAFELSKGAKARVVKVRPAADGHTHLGWVDQAGAMRYACGVAPP